MARTRASRRALTLWGLVMVNLAAMAASLVLAPFFMELGTLFPEPGSMAR